uniref:RRM domain-containing protein n=1 Tax=Parascaris equorum TaxID=6256 RepID=A0A914S175_PAREQ
MTPICALVSISYASLRSFCEGFDFFAVVAASFIASKNDFLSGQNDNDSEMSFCHPVDYDLTSFEEFDDPRDADDAVYELNGKDLCGERIILEFSRRGPRGRGMYDRYPPPRRESRPV